MHVIILAARQVLSLLHQVLGGGAGLLRILTDLATLGNALAKNQRLENLQRCRTEGMRLGTTHTSVHATNRMFNGSLSDFIFDKLPNVRSLY